MARLPQILPPRRGESVHGFVRRLAEVNGITLSAIMRWAEIGSIRPVSEDRLWANLATAAGTSVEALTKMRWLPANVPGANGAIRFMGHAIRPSHLSRGEMKVCPACIRSGGTIREVWSVSQITCCPQHGCLLIDSCNACARQLKYHSAGAEDAWSCVCGHELADLPIIPASELTLAAARLLYPVVGRTEVTGYISLAKTKDEVPAPFDTLELNDLLAAMDLIGTVATTPAEEDRPAEHTFLPYGLTGPSRVPGDFIRRAEAAVEIMLGWPESWHNILDELASRSPPQASRLEDRAVLATRMGRRCLAPDRGIDGIPLQIIARETRRWLAENKGIVRHKRHRTSESARARVLARTMNARIIAQELGIKYYVADFRRIYDETIDAMEAEGCAQPAKQLGDTLLTRVKARWDEYQRTVSSVVASDLIEGGSKERRLAGWDHVDLILPANEFEGLARKRKSVYRMNDIETILTRIRSIAVKVDTLTAYHPLTTEVMRKVLSPHYNKTAILLDVMSGRLPTYCTVNNPKLCDLYADLSLANRIGVANRAIALDTADAMIPARPLNNMVSILWGANHRLGIKESRALRQNGQIRFEVETLWNPTEQRSHPSYSYSVRDVIQHFSASLGPSYIDELDKHLIRQAD